MHVITSTGRKIELPMLNPIIREHVDNPNTLVGTLLAQVNDRKMYEFVFRGDQNQVMLDIGANIGVVSLYASDACRRIVALEPSSQFHVLKALCEPFKQIEPMQLALAGHTGSAVFMVNDVNTTASSMAQTYGVPMMVQTITLSGLLHKTGLDRVDFCKVDIEGSELECLTPYEVGLCRSRIRSYYVEVHNCPNSTWEYKLGKLVETFSHAGYGTMTVHGDALYACTQ